MKYIERQGATSEPYTHHYPKVIAGVCEYCGIMDPNQPSQYQYKLCPHFRGLDLRCSYCADHKNPDEVNKTTILNIHSHPQDPNRLAVVCKSFECSEKHLARFQLNR